MSNQLDEMQGQAKQTSLYMTVKLFQLIHLGFSTNLPQQENKPSHAAAKHKPTLPLSALLAGQDGIRESDFVSVQGILTRPGMVDCPIGKQYIVLHTVDKERCECDNKQKLTVRR